ncbi:hypothetical protein [Sphingopyxis sp.]|jgi:conjugal transfer pilus assembly protein TraB|uniref:hypothetical protein n=1 Tax=Sphingopyxis sp. TaxID=1908224 RepID=UPI0039C8CC97
MTGGPEPETLDLGEVGQPLLPESPRPERGPALLALKERWATLSSKQKLRAKQFGVAGVVALLGTGLYTASTGGSDDKPEAPTATKLDMGAGLRGDSLEVKLRGDLQKILDGQSLLGERVAAIEEGKVIPGSKPASAPDGDPGLPPALSGAIPDYPPAPGEAEGMAGEIPAPPMPPSAPPAPPAPPVEKTIGAIGAAVTAPGVIAAADGKGVPAGAKKKTRTIYLPPGFMKARLLTGIDALASRDATSNPEPLIARVQAPAVLPNDVKANLSGCFVIGNATGSLAKERVEVQLVSLSCVKRRSKGTPDRRRRGTPFRI